MSSDPASEPNLECTSDEKGTSSSSFRRDNNTNKFARHVVNLKESKTHLFYVIQSDNENSENTASLFRIKISKERPTSRKKMLRRYGNNEDLDMTDDSQQNIRKTARSNLANIQKRTDHPSFVVLPDLNSKKRDNSYIKNNIERNQSTSDNSNETYVVRSKEENKLLGSKSKVPVYSQALFGLSLLENTQTADVPYLPGFAGRSFVEPKSEGYCECDLAAVKKSKDPDHNNLLPNLQTIVTGEKTLPIHQNTLNSDELFKIKFVEATQGDVSQRLKAGQDRESRYKSCYVCPNMTRIFPPAGSRRRITVQSNYSDSGSNISLQKRNGYVKINYKLVRQCLIYASANEKSEVLDAIRLRIKSSDLDVAMNTIEDIVTFDLFGVQCECRSKPLLEELFWPINVTLPYQLQTSIAKFLNALVSYKIGRSYFNRRSIIGLLVWGNIGRTNIDAAMGDNLIGIMMKMSCNRFHCSDMIKNGLLRWLLTHMEEVEYSASRYHLKMMTGLMKNLLRSENLDELSTIEIQRLIVLLGRYLNTDNNAVKTYIYDSLLTLFQRTDIVACANELNFKKIIEEHITSAVYSKHKEQLRGINELLNSSGTPKSSNRRKFDNRPEEEPFLDSDLETDVDEEIDYYPGENLLREKFSGNEEVHRDKKNLKEFKRTDLTDDKRKDGKLVSRVFVEHLNSFLPKIDKNRIFPLCNPRSVDKTKNCSHIGDTKAKKRQPYIPPNSRTSGLPRQILKQDLKWMIPVDTSNSQQSDDESIDGMTITVQDNKSVDSQSSDHGLKKSENFLTKHSTISHDKSAAKWKHFQNKIDDTEIMTKSIPTCTNNMKPTVLKRSKTMSAVDESKIAFSVIGSADNEQMIDEFGSDTNREEVIHRVSYHVESYQSEEILKDKIKEDNVESIGTVKVSALTRRLSDISIRSSKDVQDCVKSDTYSDRPINLLEEKAVSEKESTQEAVTEPQILTDEVVARQSENLAQFEKKTEDEVTLASESDKLTKRQNTQGEETDSGLHTSSEKCLGDATTCQKLSICSMVEAKESLSERKNTDHLNARVEEVLDFNKHISGPTKKEKPRNVSNTSTLKAKSETFQSDHPPPIPSIKRASDSILSSQPVRKPMDENDCERGRVHVVHAKSDELMGTTKIIQDSSSYSIKEPKKLLGDVEKKNQSNQLEEVLSLNKNLNLSHELKALNNTVIKKTKDHELHTRSEKVLGYQNKVGPSSEPTKSKSEIIRKVHYEHDRESTSKNNSRTQLAQEVHTVKSDRKLMHINSDTILPRHQKVEPSSELTKSKSEIVIDAQNEHDRESTSKNNSRIQLYQEVHTVKSDRQLMHINSNTILSPQPMVKKDHTRSAEVLGRQNKVEQLSALTKSKSEIVRDAQNEHNRETIMKNQTLTIAKDTNKKEKLNTSLMKAKTTREASETLIKEAQDVHQLLHTSSDSILSTHPMKKSKEKINNKREMDRAKSEEIGAHLNECQMLSTLSNVEPKKTLDDVKNNHQLNAARSEELLSSNKNFKLSNKPETNENPISEVAKAHALHARSVELLSRPNEVQQLSAMTSKSKERETDRARSEEIGAHFNEGQMLKTLSVKEPKKTLDDVKNNHQLNARSEELLSSNKNSKLSHGPEAKNNPISEVAKAKALHARSVELLRRPNEIQQLSAMTSKSEEISEVRLHELPGRSEHILNETFFEAGRYQENLDNLALETNKEVGGDLKMDRSMTQHLSKTSILPRPLTQTKKNIGEMEARSKEILEKTGPKIPMKMLDDVKKQQLNINLKSTPGPTPTENPISELTMYARSMEILDHRLPGTNSIEKVGVMARHLSETLIRPLPVTKLKKNIGEHEIDHELHTRSEEIVANTNVGQNLPNRSNIEPKKALDDVESHRQLNVRSEEVYCSNRNLKLSPGPTTIENPTSEVTMNTNPTEILGRPKSDKELIAGVPLRNVLSEPELNRELLDRQIQKSQAELYSDERDRPLLISRRISDSVLSSQPTSKLNEKIHELHARSEDILNNIKISQELSTSSIIKTVKTPSGVNTNHNLLNARSQEVLCSDRGEHMVNNVDKLKENLKAMNNGITATRGSIKLHATGIISGFSSDSSLNKSSECVDCEGSGHVLRARASQPCENCTASLTKYPKFVNALNNEVLDSEDDQRRVVTLTSDEQIKVAWISKSNETNTNENQDKTKDAVVQDSKTGGSLVDDVVIERPESNQDHTITSLKQKEQVAHCDNDNHGLHARSVEISTPESDGNRTTELPSPISSVTKQSLEGVETSHAKDKNENISNSEVDQLVVDADCSAIKSNKVASVNLSPKLGAVVSPKINKNLPVFEHNSKDKGIHKRSRINLSKTVRQPRSKSFTSRIPAKKSNETPEECIQSHQSVPSKHLGGLSLNLKLNIPGSDKYLSFGSARQSKNSQSPKFVEDIVGETITTSEGNQCLQVTTTVRTSILVVDKEREINLTIDDLVIDQDESFNSVTKSEKQVEIENEKLSSKDDEIISSKVDENLEVLVDETIVSSATEQVLSVSSSKEISDGFKKDYILFARSVETTTVKVIAIPGSFSQSIREVNQEEIEIVQSDTFLSPKTVSPLVKQKSQHLLEQTSNDLTVSIEIDATPLENKSLPSDTNNLKTENVTDVLSLSSVQKSKHETVLEMKSAESLSEKFKDALLHQEIANSDSNQLQPVTSENKDNNEITNFHLKQSEKEVEEVEFIQHLPTTSVTLTGAANDAPVSDLRTSKEQVGIIGIENSPNTSTEFVKRSNEEISRIDHNLPASSVLNLNEASNGGGLSEEKLVEHDVGCSEGSISFSPKELLANQQLSQNQLPEEVPNASPNLIVKQSNIKEAGVVMMPARSVEIVTDTKCINPSSNVRSMTKRKCENRMNNGNLPEKIDVTVSKRQRKNITDLSMSNSLNKTISGVKSEPSGSSQIVKSKVNEQHLSPSSIEKLRKERLTSKSDNILTESAGTSMKKRSSQHSKDSIIGHDKTAHVITEPYNNENPIALLNQSHIYQQFTNTKQSTDQMKGGENCGRIYETKSIQSESKLNTNSAELPLPIASSDQNLKPTFTGSLQNKLISPSTSKPNSSKGPDKNQRSLCNLVKKEKDQALGGQFLAARSLETVKAETTAKLKTRQHLSSSSLRESMGGANEKSKDLIIGNVKSHQLPPRSKVMVAYDKISSKVGNLNDSFITLQACDDGAVGGVKNVELPTISPESLKNEGITKNSRDQATNVVTANVLFPRSVEMVPAIRKRKEGKEEDVRTDKTLLTEISDLIKEEARRESEKYLPSTSSKKGAKPMSGQIDDSKIPIVSSAPSCEEILLEERILSSERSIKQGVRGSSTNDQLRDERIREKRAVKEKHKLRVINSSCWKKLLNNDELINRLSEKVLKKLLTEIHICGPNCNNSCGGLNPYYNAKKDNNQNSE